MHRCAHCGRTHHQRGHLTRHYARKHPFATFLVWLVLGVPALAILLIVGIIYVISVGLAMILTGGKTGVSRGHFR